MAAMKAMMALFVSGLLVGCATTGGDHPLEVREVWAKDAKKLVASGEVVPIDVRSPHEYSTGHIPGAVLVPFGSGGTAKAVKRAMGNKQALVYCRTGRRSGLVLEELAGIPGLIHLSGGITEWKKAAGPIEKGIDGPLGAQSGLEREEKPGEDVYRFRKKPGEREGLSDVYKFF